jgi:hypothetical protein
LIAKCAIVTALAFGVLVFAIGSIEISGIHSTSLSQADLIRERCPIHLISPNWLSDISDWFKAEIYARESVVVLLWGVAIVFAVRRHLRTARVTSTI